jgi:hypothetical protein
MPVHTHTFVNLDPPTYRHSSIAPTSRHLTPMLIAAIGRPVNYPLPQVSIKPWGQGSNLLDQGIDQYFGPIDSAQYFSLNR